MKIEPQANNAVDIILSNGDVIGIRETNGKLSLNAMPKHLRVTAHNIATMKADTLGENYQISVEVILGA